MPNRCSPRKRTSRLRAAVMAALALAFTHPAAAQTPPDRVTELEKKLEESMRRIEALTNRLQQLETKAAAPAAPAGATTRPSAAATGTTGAAAPASQPVEARIEALERSVVQIGESASTAREVTVGGVPLHGFAHIGAARSTNPTPRGAKSTFEQGALNLYMTPQLSDRVKMLAELVFEYGDNQTLATDLERLQIGYTVNDALTVWMGRYHTPYGYWNTAFHHGAQIQTSVLRPRFLDFEDRGGVLPSHTVGVLASGTYKLGSGRLVYDGYFGNGSRISNAGALEPNNTRADSGSGAAGGTLGYRFGGALTGLTLGAHYYAARVGAYNAAETLTSRTRVSLTGGYLVYDENDWEILAETYRFRNTDMNGNNGTLGSSAGYLQIGKLIGWDSTPYYRYERANFNTADNFFASQTNGRSYTRHSFGLRYALNPVTALKVETGSTDEPAGAVPKSRRTMFQLSVRF